MAERIYKLQPNRTMALRGFDHLGASGAMHAAMTNSFKVTGNFRDASDFCVLIVWDADDFYEHPSIKYLPDSSFEGLTLTFDVHYTGLQPLDSKKYPSIDWPYLDAVNMDGTTAQVRLFDHVTQVSGTYQAASATFTVANNGLQAFDHVTLWYRNFAFDYMVPNPATGVTAASIAVDLARQINSQDYADAGAVVGLTATASGNQFTVTADRAGVDGNLVALMSVNKNANLQITPTQTNLAGGSSDATWRITLDFNTLGLTDVRRMWLTFAPPLTGGSVYSGGDWEAVFSNWTLSGPEDTKKLEVAGPGSVRVQQSDAGCSYSGTHNLVTGFYDQAFAQRLSGIGSTARIHYWSGVTHDVYIGTLLAPDAGVAGIRLDGDAETDLKCTLPAGSDAVYARRKVRSNVGAGEHELTMVLTLGQYCDFNFLEAAVASDIPDPLPARSNLSPALDYDTDHTYKLPPARILWNFDQLGFAGPINEYLGVFWWNQRTSIEAVVPALTMTFGGSWANGDSIFLDIGGPSSTDHTKVDRAQQFTTISKSVIYTDTPATIATHFANFIDSDFSGIWAAAQGPVLTITNRSATYSFALEVSPLTSAPNGTISLAGTLTDGTLGTWAVDPAQTPTLNTGTRAWHSDMYSLCRARGTDVVTSISMELVNPADSYKARFRDGTAVATDTGFGTLISSHCAIGGPILAYQEAVLKDLAALQVGAGLTPALQMGEFLWWFFPESPAVPQQPGMAYYDAATKAAALATLGRDLAVFNWPDDDPQVNGGADATFLRNRLRDHVAALTGTVRAAYPNARFEVLLPVDVNFATPVGPAGGQVGGPLNHAVNIPNEWLAAATAGFDYLKIEALAFGSWMRNIDLARDAIEFVPPIVWPGSRLRYLVPVFGTASHWQKEARFAMEQGYGVVNLWAFDHISLYGWRVDSDAFRGMVRSSYQG